MNKALHALVYIFLILAGAALWFETQLNDKRRTITDRNRMQEDFLCDIASHVEKVDPDKDKTIELNKDVSPVEAKNFDPPDQENVLAEYNFPLEQANLETYKWEQPERDQLRMVYKLDFEGKVQMDGDKPLDRGPGTERELLTKLLDSVKGMQTKLNNSREQLTKLREILSNQVDELNKLKPVSRQDKVTIEEKKAKIASLEEEKAGLENQIVKIKAEIDELNAEITSLKDEVATARDETEAAKDELAKSQKMVEQLKKMVQELHQQQLAQQQGQRTADGVLVSSLPAGDKGKIIEADNENMFCVIELTDVAMKELKGENLDHPIPSFELGVKRTGFSGEAGEFVGRIRLRQEIRGKNYVVCDILSNWSQDKLRKDDVIFAD